MKAAAPFMRDQWRAHASFVAEQLVGRPALPGRRERRALPMSTAYMNFWWIKAALPHLADGLLAEFPKIDAWVARVAAIGHGTADR